MPFPWEKSKKISTLALISTLVRTIVYRWKFRQASTFLAKTAGRGFARAGKKLFVGEFCQAKKLTGADLININSLLKIS